MRVIEEVWSKGWAVRYWLAPLQQTCEELFQAGFLIERLLEPTPSPESAALDPERHRRLSQEPSGFLALRALRRD